MKTALQVTVSSVLGLALIGLALFWPAGRFDYWQAWVFLGIFVVLSAIYTVYVGMKNPEVLRRRMHAGPAHESRPVQKIVSSGVVLMSSPCWLSPRSTIDSAGRTCLLRLCSSAICW